jgi:hypothetical protein
MNRFGLKAHARRLTSAALAVTISKKKKAPTFYVHSPPLNIIFDIQTFPHVGVVSLVYNPHIHKSVNIPLTLESEFTFQG